MQNHVASADVRLESAVRTSEAGAAAVSGDTANQPETGLASRAPMDDADAITASGTAAHFQTFSGV